MPDISPSNVAGPSTAQGVPEEHGETNAPPRPRTSSRGPSGTEIMEYLGFGARPPRPPNEEVTPAVPTRSAPQPAPQLTRQRALRTPADAERLGMPPELPRQLTRTLAQRWTPAAVPTSASDNPGEIPAVGTSLASTSEVRPTPDAAPPPKPFAQEMKEWARKCEADKANWYDSWMNSAESAGGFETDAHLALQETADRLTANQRNGNKTLELMFMPLPEFPADLSPLAHLQDISILNGGLRSLPESIDTLHQLHRLVLGSNPLQKLPDTLAGLTQLRSLEIINSPSLTALPGTLVSRDPTTGRRQGLVNLEVLKMRRTGLTELPNCVKYMRNLRALSLDESPVRTLPNDIHRMEHLKILTLERTAIRQLPPTLGQLTHLNHLDLQNCTQLTSLPVNIGSLRALRYLDLRGCTQLRTLPDSIRRLPPDCRIRVPAHLEVQLARLRPPPMSAAQVAAAAFAEKREQIETLSQWMLDQVTSEARNPFLEGSPPINPEPGSRQERMTLGGISALRTLLLESKQPQLLAFLQGRNAMARSERKDPLNVVNLSAAVEMWRERELAIAAKPNLVNQFPPLYVDFPKELLAETLSHPPGGTGAPDAGGPSSSTQSR